MMTFARMIATCFGIGYIEKGAGTVAALFYCAIWWVAGVAEWAWWGQAMLIAGLFGAGVWSGNVVEKAWGHDSNKVVIDEVLGMAIGLVLVPHQVLLLSVAFVLFRAFDIAKPFGIRRMEAMPGGLGVMMDDVLAGVYSLFLVHLLNFSLTNGPF